MVKLISLIFIVCLFVGVKSQGNVIFLFGGEDAPDGATPYVASLRSIFNVNFCGGAILNSRWVMTAAHCTKGRSHLQFEVVVGSNNLLSGGDTYTVESFVIHENYTDVYKGYDISLIKVSSDIAFGDRVRPIPLPAENTGAGAKLLATGWGRTSMEGENPTALQMIVLTSLSVQQCQSEFNGTHTVLDSQICTLTKPGEGTCKGDSGGPLVDDKSVVGIVSWGVPCAVGSPDVFTRVYAFKDWIQDKIVD